MRICSLLPSGTEILFALGLGDQVIGVTDLCDHPPGAARKPIVSRSLIDTSQLSSAEVNAKMQAFLQTGQSPYWLDLAWFHQEKPDLILTQDTCYICDVEASEVARAVWGVQPAPKVLVLGPRTVTEIFDSLLAVGEAAEIGDRAAEVVQQLKDRVETVVRKTSAAPFKPRVVSVEGLDPLVAGGHWIPELKILAGGRDELFTPGCPAERLSWEKIRSGRPEVLLITPCSSDLSRSLKELHLLARQEGWWDLPAVRSGEVYIIQHVYFSRPGPRVVDGLEILAQILHPRLFTGLIPPGAVLKLDFPSTLERPAAKDLVHYFHPYP